MEEILITKNNKTERYEELLRQIKSLIADESNLIANLANITL